LSELTHIEASSTPLTDASIEPLLQLAKLQSVDVTFSRISARGVRQLERARPEMHVTFADQQRYQGMLDQPEGSQAPRRQRAPGR
jgi:hypothetical protein